MMKSREPDSAKVTAMSDDLQELNRCLARYDVTMFVGADGKHRIYGNINSIQDIIDGPCLKLFGPGVRKELDEFFATEVDVRFAACLVKLGVDAVIDPTTGVGVEIKGRPPTDEEMTGCFTELHAWYRMAPDERPAQDSGAPD